MLDTCLRLASLSDGQEPGKDRQGRYGKEVRERANATTESTFSDGVRGKYPSRYSGERLRPGRRALKMKGYRK